MEINDEEVLCFTLNRNTFTTSQNQTILIDMSFATNESVLKSTYTIMDVCVCGTSFIYFDIKTKLRCVLCSPKYGDDKLMNLYLIYE